MVGESWAEPTMKLGLLFPKSWAPGIAATEGERWVSGGVGGVLM